MQYNVFRVKWSRDKNWEHHSFPLNLLSGADTDELDMTQMSWKYEINYVKTLHRNCMIIIHPFY